MDNTNNIFERKSIDGSIDYVVTMGSFFYNDKIVSLSNVVIPIKSQTFFSLPDERRFFAAVNVYYSVSKGGFVFDTIKKSEKYIDVCDGDALSNEVPIGQFIIQQSLVGFEVKKINFYSKMSTFTITDTYEKGDQGLKGPVGYTGLLGYTGLQGPTGIPGFMGYTGLQGDTGVGLQGMTGLQGCTGVYHDLNLQAYYKFKTDDIYVTDYSVYERDLLWGSTGAGVTGIIYMGASFVETGIEFIDQGQSPYALEQGIVDNCHSVQYKGGRAGYSNSRYVGLTGTINTWINVNQPPIADFICEFYTGMTGYPVRFIDASMFYPKSVRWDINGTVYTSGIVTHTFGETGMYLVTFTATNAAGAHTKTEIIMVN
jgi:hypothetical protein